MVVNKPETLRAYRRNPEKRDIIRLINKRYNAKERSKQINKNNHLKRWYGITLDEYSQIYLKQKGVCLICGNKSPNGDSLSVDHNHKTKKVRGLLCHSCNIGLGYFKDNIELLEKAKLYLKKYE